MEELVVPFVLWLEREPTPDVRHMAAPVRIPVRLITAGVVRSHPGTDAASVGDGKHE